MNEIIDIDEPTVLDIKTGVVTDNVRKESRKERDVAIGIGLIILMAITSFFNEAIYLAAVTFCVYPVVPYEFEIVIGLLLFVTYCFGMLFVCYLSYKAIISFSTYNIGNLQCCKHARLGIYLGTLVCGLIGGGIIYLFYRVKISKYIDSVHTDQTLMDVISICLALFMITITVILFIVGMIIGGEIF